MKPSPLTRRTPLRRKARMKRGDKLRAKSLKAGRALKRRAWLHFSRYIRLRDALATTGTNRVARCCTCGKLVAIGGFRGCIQAGHYRPGRGRGTLFDETACHAQCVACNKWGYGKPEEYTAFMLRTYGPEKTKLAQYRAAGRGTTWYTFELAEIASRYAARVEELGGWPFESRMKKIHGRRG